MKLKSLIFGLLSAVTVLSVSAQGDNPCQAPMLPVVESNVCTGAQTGTTVGSTATSGVPAPGCASYSGNDVWYQVTVPANGSLKVTLSAGSITDSGMAWYTASSCNGPFTLLECDDDDADGLMSMIQRTGLTPGSIIYVRVWKYGSGTGTFSICANSPVPPEPCIGGNNFSCATAQPFCSENQTITYCNAFAGSSPSLGSYGCLYSTPNPMWLYLEISQAGYLSINIQQQNMNNNNIDVDFALYGPYNDLASGCPVIGPNTPTVDCSFSASATENVDIPNAQVGQIYVLLVTNYNGQQGQITFTNNANSTGATDCSIVLPCSVSATMTPDVCGQGVGSVNATVNNGLAPYTYSWNAPGNPTTQSVSNLPAGTYQVSISTDDGCEATANVTVTNQQPTFTSSATPAQCSTGTNGTATANYPNPPAGVTVVSYQWNDANQQTTQTATGLTPGSYTCTLTLSNGCIGTTTVNVGFGTVSSNNSTTPVSCPGGADGTATANFLPANGTYTYQWNDPLGQTTQTAVGLSAGTYQCVITNQNNCSVTTNVTVTEIPGVQAAFTTTNHVTCYTKNDGVLKVTATGGTTPYTYSWSNSQSTTHTADDLFAGNQSVTVTDANGCFVSINQVLTQPNPLQITQLTPDTQICPEDNITLTVNGTGGSSEYTYTWSSNGVVIGTGASITVDPEVTNTTYCVQLSEACGSPSTDSCMLVYFPVPTTPQLTPDKYVDCRPGEFIITNTSNNIGEIATTYIDFGNGTNVILYNGEDTTIVYPDAGVYTLQVINTNIYGCVYQTTLENFLTVTPDPTANFYIGGNPTTIFETTVSVHDLSSSDVVQWEWYSPFSNPSTSNLEDPKFTFPEGVEGIYPITLIVTSNHGCKDTITLNAIVEEAILIFVPNTFTPDGDEFNQQWKVHVRGGDPYGFHLVVFNRWGEMVWETYDPNVGWDGTYAGQASPQGTYTWKASIKNKNDDGKTEYNGHLNILR